MSRLARVYEEKEDEDERSVMSDRCLSSPTAAAFSIHLPPNKIGFSVGSLAQTGHSRPPHRVVGSERAEIYASVFDA